MGDRLTLREVARLANVSTATVSRAINRVPTVNPVLARRIRKVIEKEGYFPNTNARALVRGCSRSLGLSSLRNHQPLFPGDRANLREAGRSGKLRNFIEFYRPRSTIAGDGGSAND